MEFVKFSFSRLGRDFFERPAEEVAPELLGTYIVHGDRVGKIVETEAYVGEHDLACHAAKGRTKRTEVMYGPGGFSYIYFIYGMHWLFNVVTLGQGSAAAVLIRAVEPVSGEVGPTNGPAKWTREFSLTGKESGVDLVTSGELKILRDPGQPELDIAVTPRINVAYARDWAAAPLRYLIAGNPFVSGPKALSSSLPNKNRT